MSDKITALLHRPHLPLFREEHLAHLLKGKGARADAAENADLIACFITTKSAPKTNTFHYSIRMTPVALF